jgi:hypothetical protein
LTIEVEDYRKIKPATWNNPADTRPSPDACPVRLFAVEVIEFLPSNRDAHEHVNRGFRVAGLRAVMRNDP